MMPGYGCWYAIRGAGQLGIAAETEEGGAHVDTCPVASNAAMRAPRFVSASMFSGLERQRYFGVYLCS